MKPALRLLTCVLPLSFACRTTVDTGDTLREVASTRHGVVT